MTTQDISRLLEAVIFSSAQPLTLSALMKWCPDLNEQTVFSLLLDLKKTYLGRGVELVEHGGGWCFRTAVDLADDLQMEVEVEKKLSRAAMETLAIIAYHQPLTRAEIENIRGVATGKGTLDLLTEAGWIKPGKRRDTPGRPLTWVTTSSFLTHFGLESITDLPGLDELKSAGILDVRPSVAAVALSGELFEDTDED